MAKLYHNCRELPVHNFNEVMYTGNLQWLVVNGEVDDYTLRDTWISILSEYYDLTGNNKEFIKKKQLLKQITELNALEVFINVHGTLSKKEREKYYKELKVTEKNLITRYKRISNIVRLELEAQKDKKNEGSIRDLDKSLAILNENGFVVDRYKTPLSEYLAYIERLNDKVKAMNNQNKKGR